MKYIDGVYQYPDKLRQEMEGFLHKELCQYVEEEHVVLLGSDINGKDEEICIHLTAEFVVLARRMRTEICRWKAPIDYMQDCTNFQSEDLGGWAQEYHRQKNMMWCA